MRRGMRWFGWMMAVLLGLPVLAVAVLMLGLNTDPGRRLAEHATQRFSGGTVVLSGVSGRFPDALLAVRLEVRDGKGTWLTVRDAALDWRPSRLLAGEARITRLTAAEVAVARLPASAPTQPGSAASSGTTWSLPVRVVLDALRIDRVTLAAAIAGAPAVLVAEGNGELRALEDGSGEVTVRRLDGGGTYHLHGTVSAAAVSATLSAEEPAEGLATALAGLPELGALSLEASAEGPWSGIATKLALHAGNLWASAQGQVNVSGQTVDLDVAASAPAMAPRPDLAWQSVQVDAHVHGPWLRPRAQGTVAIDGLTAAGAALHRLSATMQGDLGKVSVSATADGVRVPGPAPDLLAAAPVTLRAEAQLDDPARPVTFALAHPLLALTGTARTAGAMSAQAHLDLPDLAPLAALGAPAMQGHVALDLTATLPGKVPTLTAEGVVAVTGGMAPLPGLGADTHVAVAAALHGARLEVSRFAVDGHAVSLAAHGDLAESGLDVTWQAGLPDVSVLAPTVQGDVQATGHVHGPPTSFVVEAELTGDIATAQVPRGPLKVSLAAHGLPDAPTGTVSAEGSFDGAPLALDLSAGRQADGTLHLGIVRADWKSLHAEGALSLAQGADLPAGRITLRMDRLDDLASLLGQRLAGSLTADVTAEGQQTRVQATIRNAALAGTASVATAALDVRVRDPLGAQTIDGSLDLGGLGAGGLGGTARLEAKGSPAALALQLRTALTGVGDSPLQATAAARLDVPGKTVTIAALQADWHGETLRLLAPARIAFGTGISVDRARLGLRDAVLEVAGKVAPSLDLTASLRNLPADLARVFLPDTHPTGMLEADARLTGALARPDGRLHLAATGLHLGHGQAAALPAVAVVADATLAGGAAQLRARVSAGQNQLSVTGSAPLDPSGAMDLRATGAVDLKVLDPLLAGEGRRARGQITLDATIAGTIAAPQASGALRLANGDVQDIGQGLHVSGLDALVEAAGDSLHIVHLTGKTGRGSLSASGTVGLASTLPVDLTITAKNAQPLTTDLLTENLDADLKLNGDLTGGLTVSGNVTVNRADITVPERLPAKVAVLDVRRPGQAPPPATGGGPSLGLNVTLRSPGQIFVRGRGLDAELEGRISIAGTTSAPQPSGRFTLRSGSFNLAGTTLRFTSGDIGFDGSGRLDPTLNLVASSTTSSITATLTITGYASAPKITLSSSPELPQDEVLAQLLFHQSAVSLTGLQLAQAAAALAQISGVDGGFDPLNKVRTSLGLDRLAVGSAPTGNGATLEAGRYVRPGLYVGARQGSSGSGTQALVQFDVTRRLKLQATAGTGGATSATGASTTDDPGTSVGVTYQFDY